MRYWNWLAPFYNVGIKAFLAPFGGEVAVKNAFLDRADLAEGMTVLDLACATGTLTDLAGKRVGPSGLAVGIDNAVEMVVRAQSARRHAAFACADAADLPFRSNVFDRVVALLAIHEIDASRRREAIKEIHRVLKPEGCFIVGDYPSNPSGLRGRILRGILRIVEPGAAGVLAGEHVEAIEAFFRVDRRERFLYGCGEIITAYKP